MRVIFNQNGSVNYTNQTGQSVTMRKKHAEQAVRDSKACRCGDCFCCNMAAAYKAAGKSIR